MAATASSRPAAGGAFWGNPVDFGSEPSVTAQVWMGGDRAREPFAVIPRLDLPTDPALLKKNKDELELGEIGALIEHDRDTADENKAEN